MSIGKAIVIIRQRMGIRQTTLAKECGLSPTSLSLIESDKTYPKRDTLIKIAKVLKTDIGLIELLSVNPFTDFSEPARTKFITTYPDFTEKVLSIIL